jgi:trypsin
MRINSPLTGVTPVTLNSNFQVPAKGDNLTVIRFGDLKSGAGSYPTFLQDVNLLLVPQDKCNQQYSSAIDSSTMICTGLGQGGKDSRQGDSGGPLLKIVNGVHTQVGIVSWGNGCALAGSPGVYSRVSGQITWIQSEARRLTKTNPQPTYCTGTTGTGGTGGTGGNGTLPLCG